jgi:hypothetical protein
MNNVCFTVLVQNCRCLHPVHLDSGEDLLTRLVPVSDLPQLVAEGKIRHSLVAVALYYFDLWKRGCLTPAPATNPQSAASGRAGGL